MIPKDEIVSPEPARQPVQAPALVISTPAREAEILYFPLWPREKALASAPVLASRRERVWAHAIDAIFVHGFSVYFSKWCAVIMANSYSQYFRGSDQTRENFYLDTINFAMPRIWLASFCFFSLIYVVASHHWWGRSLGKALLGLRVIDENGATPSVGSGLRRYAAYFLSYATCGWSFYLFHTHESFTQTKVIREK